MEQMPEDKKMTEEEIQAWRKKHAKDLNPEHSFVQGPGNSLSEVSEIDEQDREEMNKE